MRATLTADIEAIPADLPAAPPSPTKKGEQPPTPPAGKDVAAKPDAKSAQPATDKTPAAKNAATDPDAKKAEGPKTGHFRDTLTGETKATYWAYVPESYSAQDGWGLVVWIAPGRDSMEAAVFNRSRKACEERRLIVVAPLPGEGGDFTANDLVGAWRVVERFVKDYRIDANRLVVHSYGRGGGFAAFMAFENRERVRGLALASSMLQVPPPEADPSYPFHFFFSVNRGDRPGGPAAAPHRGAARIEVRRHRPEGVGPRARLSRRRRSRRGGAGSIRSTASEKRAARALNSPT